MSSGKLLKNQSPSKPNPPEEIDSERDLNHPTTTDKPDTQNPPTTTTAQVQRTSLQRTSLRRNSELNSASRITSSSNSKSKRRPKWKKAIISFLDSTPVLIIMSVLTLFALFASDIKAAWLRIEVDEAFNIIQCILIGIFGIEFILNCIAKKDYLLSFFFWLDLISTVSIIQDIDYIMNPILGYGPQKKTTSNKSTAAATKAISKVSSASRATRVLRVVRIVRLIRMVKLYKSVYIAREKAEKEKKRAKKEQKRS